MKHGLPQRAISSSQIAIELSPLLRQTNFHPMSHVNRDKDMVLEQSNTVPYSIYKQYLSHLKIDLYLTLNTTGYVHKVCVDILQSF